MTLAYTVRLALDRSVRSYDTDGRLRVSTALLSRAEVSPYLGVEVPGYDTLGLTPSRVYQLLRPEGELQRALANFNGLPILTRHVPVSADDYRGDLVVGSTGSSAALVNFDVTNSLTIWASPGIELIESGAARSLSCGYGYTPVVRSGSFQGRPYQIVMTDLKPNHVALVAEPRVAGAMVGDAMPKSFLKRKRNRNMEQSGSLDDNDDFTQICGALMDYLGALLPPDQLDAVQTILKGGDVPMPEGAAMDQAAQARRARAMAADSAVSRRREMFPNWDRLQG